MKIIGFNFTKISIEREEKPFKKLDINQNINIIDIQKEKNPLSEEDLLKLTFSLSITYSENYAKLDFKGNIILIPGKEELDEFIISWKDKKIPEKFWIPLFNFINAKCNIKAIYLEDELSLPLHLQNFMPKIINKSYSKE